MDMLAEYEEINLKFGLPEYYENEDKMNSFLLVADFKINLIPLMHGV